MIAHQTFGNTSAPNLTFIHGWAGQAHLWHDWIEASFGVDYCCHTLELPGHGQSDPLPSGSQWQAALYEALPINTALVGWSLGGLLAQSMALQETQACLKTHKINQLVCLATTPCFAQAQGWNWGISPELLGQFFQGLGVDASAILTHFWKLQMQGSPNAKALIRNWLKQLKAWQMPELNSLAQGLELIKHIDHRTQLHYLHQPTLWLLGERDPLIQANPLLHALASLQPNAAVKIIAQAGHSPFLSHPQETAQAIVQFLTLTDATRD